MIRIRSPKSRRPNSWDPLKVQLDNWNAIYMATQQLVSYGRQKFESFLNGGTIGTGFRLECSYAPKITVVLVGLCR